MAQERQSEDVGYYKPDMRARFMEGLPKGFGVLQIADSAKLRNNKEIIDDMLRLGAFNQFRMLCWFAPEDRTALVENINWMKIAQDIAIADTHSTNSIVLKARDALGEENIFALALSYFHRAYFRKNITAQFVDYYLRAGIKLARILPATDLPSVFVQYSNIARMEGSCPFTNDHYDVPFWNGFFSEAIKTLYLNWLFNQERNPSIPLGKISKMVETIIKEDVAVLASKIRYLALDYCDFELIELRYLLDDPSVLDAVIESLGHEWHEFRTCHPRA